VPEQYHPIVNMMDDNELELFLKNISQSVTARVGQLPKHLDFINYYCKAG